MIISSIYKIIRAFSRKIANDNISAFSALAALFVIISLFPFLMLLLTLLQYIPITEGTMLETLTNIFPSSISPLLVRIVLEINPKTSGTIISITIITTLWTASRGSLAIIKGLNSVYCIKESRNYFRLRLISSFYTFVFAIMLIITLAILVFGNLLYVYVENKFPVMRDFALLIISMRTIIGLCLLTIFFLLVYVVIPDRKTKILQEFPGALISAAGWMGFSYLYSFYIDNMSNFTRMYGSLTAIVLFMLWFYFCMYIMFIGGEINIVLSSGDLGYFLKQLFIKRKAIKQHLIYGTSGEIHVHEITEKPLDRIIEETMSDKNGPNEKK